MPPLVHPGEILAHKYVVERVLGAGGMGVVVSATHQQLGQRVAVKFLQSNIAENPEAVARFLREAQAAVQIRSEHVARVIDVGTLETGAPYMVMEYLSGRDLAEELAIRTQLPVEEAVTYVLQACEAVAEAHAVGIVHRDLKPANLFLAHHVDGTPLVKVLDFGISKALPQAGGVQSLTSTQSVMGSPLYMSPEQLKSSKNVDQRTDIWALGVILHEIIAGCPPFRSDTVSGLIATVVTEPPPPLRALRHEVPEALEQLVLRCLEKNADQRVQHVGELAKGLQPFAPRQAAISVPRILGVLRSGGLVTPLELPATARIPSDGQTGFDHVAPVRDRSSRGALLAVGVTAVTLVSVAIMAAALSKKSALLPTTPLASVELASSTSQHAPSLARAAPQAPTGLGAAGPVPSVSIAPSSRGAPEPSAAVPDAKRQLPIATQRVRHGSTSPKPSLDPLDGRR